MSSVLPRRLLWRRRSLCGLEREQRLCCLDEKQLYDCQICAEALIANFAQIGEHFIMLKVLFLVDFYISNKIFINIVDNKIYPSLL